MLIHKQVQRPLVRGLPNSLKKATMSSLTSTEGISVSPHLPQVLTAFLGLATLRHDSLSVFFSFAFNTDND